MASGSTVTNGRTLCAATRRRFSPGCASATNQRSLFTASLEFGWRTVFTLPTLAQNSSPIRALRLTSRLGESGAARQCARESAKSIDADLRKSELRRNAMNSSFLIQQIAFAGPVLVVYLVGMVLAVIFIQKYPVPAILTLLATIILLGNIFGVAFAQAYFMRFRLGVFGPVASYSTIFSVVSVIGSVMRAVGSALLLTAVFVGRKSKTVQV